MKRCGSPACELRIRHASKRENQVARERLFCRRASFPSPKGQHGVQSAKSKRV